MNNGIDEIEPIVLKQMYKNQFYLIIVHILEEEVQNRERFRGYDDEYDSRDRYRGRRNIEE